MVTFEDCVNITLNYFKQEFLEKQRRIGPHSFDVKLIKMLHDPNSRLTHAHIRGNHWEDYTITLLPGRESHGTGHMIHGRLLHTIPVKTICQMQRSTNFKGERS
jgi:hypothetical protein